MKTKAQLIKEAEAMVVRAAEAIGRTWKGGRVSATDGSAEFLHQQHRRIGRLAIDVLNEMEPKT